METVSNYVLMYWAISGFICAGLFANINESDLTQHPQAGWQTPFVRNALYFVFGGAILPMVLLVGGAVNAAAVAAWGFMATRRSGGEKAPESGAP